MAALALCATTAAAAPALRVHVAQHGDFVMIGNTLGHDCNTASLIVGTVGACGTNVADSAPDVFWVSDDPAPGMASANTANTPSQARSTAVLTVPNGATITHAFLYWAATAPSNAADPVVTVDRRGVFTQDVTATQSFLAGVHNAYQSVADVTALVQQYGSGAYRVAGVDAVSLVNLNDGNVYAGWVLIVLYTVPGAPLRDLAIFDGLDYVTPAQSVVASLSGLGVPAAGVTGTLGVIAYEGDDTGTGDSLFFNGGPPLANAMNPTSNVFNGTRSQLGAPVSVAGDLPQLMGTPQSESGIDLDTFDVTPYLTQGQTSATIQAITSGDTVYVGAFITSIATALPDLESTTKTVMDLDGAPTIPGDTLEYTITVINSGNDGATNTIATDVLPPGVTYVAGSLATDGQPQTDAAGDDVGEYDETTRTITVRVGSGAATTVGGTLEANTSRTIAFRVTVDAGVTGEISNQGQVSAMGVLAGTEATAPTDGNGAGPGAPPTTITAQECGTDAHCGDATSGRVCNAEVCEDGCRGAGGNGCAAGRTCTSSDDTIGTCVPCVSNANCANPTPVCATDQTCVGCTSDPDCAGNSAGAVCADTGACVECIEDTSCTSAAPRCDPSSHTCVTCLGAECTPDGGFPDDSSTQPGGCCETGGGGAGSRLALAFSVMLALRRRRAKR